MVATRIGRELGHSHNNSTVRRLENAGLKKAVQISFPENFSDL